MPPGELGVVGLDRIADSSSLFTALPVSAFALSPAGDVVAWNAAAERTFGWTRAEVLGRPAPLFPGPALAAALAAVRRAVEARCDDPIPLACADRSGATRIVRFGTTAADGALLLVTVGGNADGASEARRLQAVLDAIPAPIFFKDAAGAYLGFNGAFERYIGIPRERLLGRTVFDVAPPDLAEVYRAADDALLGSGEPQIYETRVQWVDGTRRDVIFHKAVLRDGAGERGVVPAARRERPGPRRHPRARPHRVREPGDARGPAGLARGGGGLERGRLDPPGRRGGHRAVPDRRRADAAVAAPPARARRQLRDRGVPRHLDRHGGPGRPRRDRPRSHRADAGAGAARARAAARRDRHARGGRRARAQHPAHVRPLERRARRRRAAPAARRARRRRRLGRGDPRARRRARGRGADAHQDRKS